MRQHDGVLDGLAAALSEVRGHRVDGVAEQGDPATVEGGRPGGRGVDDIAEHGGRIGGGEEVGDGVVPGAEAAQQLGPFSPVVCQAAMARTASPASRVSRARWALGARAMPAPLRCAAAGCRAAATPRRRPPPRATRRPELRAVYDGAGRAFRGPVVAMLAAAGSADPERHTLSVVAWCDGVLFSCTAGQFHAAVPTRDALRTSCTELLDGMLRR